jgi:prepilin-type N-terminal cleavage/methylation domain-containing protein
MPARADGAFTLVETLVALAVTSVLLAALATVVPAALRAQEGSRARLGRAAAADAALGRLARELATALDEPFVLDAARARLAFSGGEEPGERLAYVVAGGALVRRATPRFAPEDEAARGTSVLGDVRAVELAAFDGREWVAAWRRDRPPAALRVRIVFTDGETLGTVVPVPTARSAG